MNEISHKLVLDAKSLNRQRISIRNEMFKVLIQDEFIEYFSDPKQNYGGGLFEEYHGLANVFKQQIIEIYYAGFFSKSLLKHLSQRFCRVKGCVTVAYEKISDEDFNTLNAEEIVTIYMGEIIHERWGGAFKSLFEHPFFLKSLKRLKQLMEK